MHEALLPDTCLLFLLLLPSLLLSIALNIPNFIFKRQVSSPANFEDVPKYLSGCHDILNLHLVSNLQLHTGEIIHLESFNSAQQCISAGQGGTAILLNELNSARCHSLV